MGSPSDDLQSMYLRPNEGSCNSFSSVRQSLDAIQCMIAIFEEEKNYLTILSRFRQSRIRKSCGKNLLYSKFDLRILLEPVLTTTCELNSVWTESETHRQDNRQLT